MTLDWVVAYDDPPPAVAFGTRSSMSVHRFASPERCTPRRGDDCDVDVDGSSSSPRRKPYLSIRTIFSADAAPVEELAWVVEPSPPPPATSASIGDTLRNTSCGSMT